MLALLLAVSLIGRAEAASELLHNPDFESSFGASNWFCNGCHLSKSSDSYHGHSSAKITQRSHNWAGLSQTVNVKGNHRYVFKAYIKLLSHTLPYHNVELMIHATSSSGGHGKFITCGESPYVQQTSQWVEIGFDKVIPDGSDKATVYIQINEPGVNYLVDGASFQELVLDTNWKSEALNRIEQMRKNDVHIKVANHGNVNLHGVTVELNQTSSAFAFGTAVRFDLVTNPSATGYQKYLYDNFEWATVANAFKWRLMEYTQGHPNFDHGMGALNALLAKGMTVRGHNMYWGVHGHYPAWLDQLSEQQVLQAMHTHINDMISHTRGKFAHWDVNNENLHGDYFEKKTGHPNITMDMFQWLHSAEPGVKLFLNEYNALNSGRYTTSLKEQGRIFRDAGIPIYGIGEQSHFNHGHDDMSTVKYRLDKSAEANLPLWITELSVADSDANRKAQTFEDLLTLYFSHPCRRGHHHLGVLSRGHAM
ncbi:anti-sigma-I factor RsgI6-like [Pecten maximus]|uniref:anti-sigma-I factor RsgI6-like n=1 Tax=Pecten maximus TaxID=6579 RepID=UPI0014586F03|nr:anti-sigma-I factor RsgI6-like [Pecten maximus]